MRRAVWGALLVVSAASVALLSACTGVTDAGPAPVDTPTPTAAPLPEGVTVAVTQERSDYGDRRLQVRVTNGTGQDFEVTGVTFGSADFVSPVTNGESGIVHPALALDFPVLLPAPVCDASPGEPSVELQFVTADGGTGRAEVTPDDPLGSLARINGEDCLAQGVAEVVTIAPAGDLRVDGSGPSSVAHIDLAFTPTGAPGSVTIADIGVTPLLAPLGGASSWTVGRTIDASTPSFSLTLDAQPGRCEPHVIAEDKRGTFLPFTVTVQPASGPAVSGTYYIALSDTAKGEVYTWLADHCGF